MATRRRFIFAALIVVGLGSGLQTRAEGAILTCSDGARYEGEYWNDQRHGQGLIIKPDGNKYTDEYNQGTLFGQLTELKDQGSARPARKLAQTFVNDLGIEFVLIPAGSFTMGADKSFEDASDDEMPAHRVTISRPFYLGKYEVTQSQWVAVMGNNPSGAKGRNNPVENVSWDDAQEFIEKLNQQEGAGKYRLPTEAEWEYAARAGTTSTYSFGDDTEALWRYAWYSGNSIPPCPESLNNCLNFLEANAHPVGQKKPNAWGLYDMHGNVLEWVQDWYGEKYYSGSSGTDPQGPSSGSYRVGRGGRWDGSVRDCRSAYRDGGTPDSRYNFLGFRLAFSPGQ